MSEAKASSGLVYSLTGNIVKKREMWVRSNKRNDVVTVDISLVLHFPIYLKWEIFFKPGNFDSLPAENNTRNHPVQL